MLAIKELRHPAAACARSDRRQSREVRAVGRGGAQCDGLSEDASVRPRVSHVWGGERVLLSGGMSCVWVFAAYMLYPAARRTCFDNQNLPQNLRPPLEIC